MVNSVSLKKQKQSKKTKKEESVSTVSLPETTPAPSSSQAQPQKKSSILQKSISILAFLVGFFVVGYLLSNNNGFSGTGVHITELTYHYYNPETGLKWTYSLPNGFNMGVGTTTNITTSFTSNLTCSMTISQGYATTQGFTYFIHNLPVTFEPSQPGNYTVTITAPTHQYSGTLNVDITIIYGYGC